MSRSTVLNLILGLIAVSLVGTLVYLETSDSPASTTTTSTTSTSTTTTSTTVPPATSTTSTTTTSTTSTTTTSTSTSTTTTSTTEVPIERFFVGTVIVNGSTVGERLEPAVTRLRDAGYFDVRGLIGAVQVQVTSVYARDESFRAEAEVVAGDLGFVVGDAPGEVSIGLFEEAPPVSGVLDAKVMVYLGPEGVPPLPPEDDG